MIHHLVFITKQNIWKINTYRTQVKITDERMIISPISISKCGKSGGKKEEM